MSESVLTRPQFATCAAYLAAGVGRPMSKEQLEVYYDNLNDIPFEVLKASCKAAVQMQKENWLPAVGAIRAHATELVYGVIPGWSDEWDNVRKLIRRFDISRKTEAYSHMSALTQQAVTAVGWSSICDSETSSMHAAQFKSAYESLAARESSFRRVSPELRPRITAGASITISSDVKPALRIAQQLADKLPAIRSEDEPCPTPRK